ncbi:MAG: amidohydrolase [Candidatus Dormibacteraeota bacterium]|uniref:Amidohydrolase n=1 Tax=Candidatus Dormiibacter inghamiae TaxID=3127013 RepID=A0A934KC86_9BACT|nr:amidohydrolase [Candidatus Dormibacteraeota bacterium]MBJ7606190.1 amidohydrolase [Candidatus Dormibacteraeota bacterium]
MKIDVHNHAIPDAALELLRSDPAYRTQIDGDRISGGNHVNFTLMASFRDPDAKLAELESKRLEAAVVSVAPPLFFYEVGPEAGEAIAKATNQGLREFAAAHPDHYRWMAHVPMADPGRAAAVLEEAIGAGAVGVEIGTSVAGRRLDEPEFEPFWAAAERLQTPVMLHPAYNEPHRGLDQFYLQNVIGNQLETTTAIERLIASGLLGRHPRLKVVLVHAGGYYPFQAGRLRHATTVRPELESAPADPWSFRGQVVVDTITHDRDALAYLVSRMGAENVVLGTDLPFDMAPPQPVNELDQALDAATARTIAEDNPARLYRFVD